MVLQPLDTQLPIQHDLPTAREASSGYWFCEVLPILADLSLS